jgi:3-oxoadipate enol-lactonase
MGFESVRFADVPLGKVAYYDAGTGEPLLMHHGGEGSKTQYAAVVPHLAEGIHAISFDQRDVADSFRSADPYTMADLADDSARFLDALGIDKAHMLGTSFDGALALNVAVRHPDRVRTLTVAVAPVTSATLAESTRRLTELPREEFIEAFARAAFSDEALRDPNTMAFVRRAMSAVVMGQESNRRAAIETHDVSAQLASITAPTLLLYGSDDPLVPIEHGQQLAAGIRNSELVVFEGARHGLVSEFKERVAGHVSAFVLAHPISG